MVKRLTLIKRQAGLDWQEFLDYWRKEHVPLSAKLPGLRRQCSNITVVKPGREPRFDLIAEAWWDDVAQLKAAEASATGKAVRESLARAVDAEQTLSAVLSERVIVPIPAGGPFLKNFVVLYRRPDVSFEHFDRYWEEKHPLVVNRLPGLGGYKQCPAVQLPDETPSFDGCAMVWISDFEAMREANRGPVVAAIRADELNFLDQSRMISIVAAEEA